MLARLDIIDKIENLNSIDSNGNTYFHLNFFDISTNQIIYAISKGFDVNIKNNKEQTFLHNPIFYYENTEIYLNDDDLFIKFLFDRNFDFNHKDINGFTIFHKNYLPNLFTECLKNNKFSLKNNDTIFNYNENYFNVIFENKLIIDFNIKSFDKFFRTNVKEEYLLYAIENGLDVNKTELIHYLYYGHIDNPKILLKAIEKGFDIHSKNNSGNTVFHLNKNLFPIAKKYNFNFNTVNNEGDTIFHTQSSLLLFYKHLKNLIDLNAKNNHGKTIIYDAYHLTIPILKYFINNGLDQNSVDNNGNTILHETRNKEIVKFLINHEKTDLSIINNKGETVLDCLYKNFKDISFLRR